MSETESPGSWEDTWERQLASAPRGLDEPSLENHIDALKLEFLRPDLPAAGRAVEIGCGSARLLARIGRAAPLQLVGVDTSDSALRLAGLTAEAVGVTIQGVSADARALPFPDHSFDLVLSGGLLEHFPDPRPVLAEMVRVLRVGGTFYADVVPRRWSLYRVREVPRMRRSAWLLPGVYESSLGPGAYRDALAALGCRSIRTRSAGVYPPGDALRWARWTRQLDGTVVADALGWYFMLAARRR